MNILIYLEPFPLRNSFTMFRGVIEHFKHIFRTSPSNGHKIMLYGNQQTLASIVASYKHIEPFCIRPSTEEQSLFNSGFANWDLEGMKTWQELMSGGDIALRYKEMIKNLYYKYHFDYIVHWGTNAAVRQAAKELNIGYVDMELGCSRRPYLSTLVADPWGANGASSLSQADIEDFSDMPDGNTSLSDLQEYYSLSPDEGWLQSFFYFNDEKLLSLAQKNHKIAFIPLQLYDDANLLMYSPYKEVINVLEDIVPRLRAAGYTCVIKEHPASSIRHGSSQANYKARCYAEHFDNVVWLDTSYKDLPNAVLFRISDVVITVNSSVGFEALFYDKDLVVLGDAVYKVKGLFPGLDQYLSGQWNRSEYVKSIAKLRNFFLKYYLIPDNYFSHPDIFIEKIRFIGDLSKKELSAKQIIQAFRH